MVMASICFDSHKLPLWIFYNDGRNSIISVVLLSARFHFIEGSIQVQEEVLDDEGVKIHTIYETQFERDDGRVYISGSRKYKVFGLILYEMHASIEILIHRRSTTFAVNVYTLAKVK